MTQQQKNATEHAPMFSFKSVNFLQDTPPTVSEYHLTTTLSESAITRLHELLKHEEEGKAFRVRISSGGCSGMQYHFSFDTPSQQDLKAQYQDVTLIIDPQSAALLKGAEVDYVSHISGAYFTIKNPLAKSSCGCGSSFSI